MKRQVYNPFLPLNEYIPDGEPHVFGDRIYLFGSHDKAGGSNYCLLDYVIWSAPVGDLTDWSCKGISYSAQRDPLYQKGMQYMYAPDVVKGTDERFYLYYCMAGKQANCYQNPISVAVSDVPDGPYDFYGYVKNKDGSIYDKYVPFDPAVINDDGVIRLYYGTCYPFDKLPVYLKWLTPFAQAKVYGKSFCELRNQKDGIMGAITVELEQDMLTVKGEPRKIIGAVSKGTSYEEHPFWEGSSIRKINGLYYFIYSSFHNHELCYATSDYPDRDFTFRGTIISNGDIGYQGRKEEERINHTGTNHGSIEYINGKWYVFYHRNTHNLRWSRQACAEPIKILADGTILQVEISSCGLNGGPLRAQGSYSAAICCQLSNQAMPHGKNKLGLKIPQITHSGKECYITSICQNTQIGYKYFEFKKEVDFYIIYRGEGKGILSVVGNLAEMEKLEITPQKEWSKVQKLITGQGIINLKLEFQGDGSIDLLEIGFNCSEDLDERKK